jgi:hypothetical protein
MGISILSSAIAGLLLNPILNLSANTGMVVLGLKLVALFTGHIVIYFLFLVIFRVINIHSIYSSLRIPGATK